MKTTELIFPIAALSGVLFLTNCADDPSENVPSAGVSDVEEVETPQTTTEPAPSAVEPAPAPEASIIETKPSAASAPADAVTYVFTEESKIKFVGSKVTGSHDGGFEDFSGTFQVAGDQPGQGPHRIEIDMNSVWTDAEKLTGHLKSPDFFDVEKFPTSRFELNSVEPAEGENLFTLSGEFTLHGVTKTINFPAVITTENEKVRLEAEFSINRKDFGIVYTGKADDLIRDGVVIRLAMVAEPEI